MEKQSRAYFGVFRVNRLTLIVLGLLVVALATYRFNPVQRVTKMVDRIQSGRVQAGVKLEGQDLSGKSYDEVRLLVEAKARQRATAPQDALVDERNNRIIPDVSGREVDVPGTVEAVMRAPAGANVDFAFREVAARTTLAQHPALPVYQGNPAKQAVSFAVNVAWDRGQSLTRILKAFHDAGVKATFFITGKWAKSNRELVKDIAAAGHEVAIHGHDDSKQPAKMSRDELVQDIELARRTVEEISGQRVQYYTPHLAQMTKAVAETAAELGLRPVMYSLDTVDWRNPPVRTLVKRIVDGAENGAIILVHPVPSTAQGIAEAIAGLQKRGFDTVTVGELISPAPIGRSQPVPASTAPGGVTPRAASPGPGRPASAPVPALRGVPVQPAR